MEKRQEEIERYLKGTMTEEEQFTFEQRLKTDQQLNAEVLLQARTIRSIRKVGAERDEAILGVLKQISTINLEKVIARKSATRLVPRFLKFASAIAAIVVLVISLNTFSDYRRADKLYAEYYTPFAKDNIWRGGIEEPSFNVAMSLWETGRANEAFAALEKILAQGDESNYYQDAGWYLALFYLKKHQLDKARETLNRLVKEDGYYADRAAELLEKMKKLH